ncbi:hypothetical protein GOBAR_DD06645 [Gossypium barbadense]|nr:hypothetical protein GOBAR_DD06645 [Gossypium barbadense]
MDDKFFVCVYFDGIILTTTVGCIFECRQQIAMRFNRNVSLDDMKGMINAKIVRRYGRRISKIFYKFSVLTNQIKFTEMKLVDDEDVETMVALYCGNESDKNAPIHLFAELAGMEQNEDVNAYGEEHRAQESCMVAPISYVDSESTIGGIGIDLNITPDIDVVGDDGYDGSDHCDKEIDSDSDPDVDDVPDDINDEDVNNDENINTSSVGNQMRGILIHNNPGPHMSLIGPDAAHIAEFSEYPEIVPAHRLAVNSDHEELFLGQRFERSVRRQQKAAIWRVRAAFIQAYELEPHIFRQRMIRLESDMEGQTNTSFRQWLGTMESWQWSQSFDGGFRYSQMTTNLVAGVNAVLLKIRNLSIASVFSATFYRLATLMPRMGQQQVDQMEDGHMSYGVDLRNRRCDCSRFKTLHYPYVHVVAACAKVNLNVGQFVDDVYTLKRTLRVWENEFPALPDLSTWEVPPTTFELVPDRGLRRNPRGHLQSS